MSGTGAKDDATAASVPLVGAQEPSEASIFDNVWFQEHIMEDEITLELKKEDGTITLTKHGFFYEATGGEGVSKTMISWAEVAWAPVLISLANTTKHIMEIRTTDNSTRIFQMPSRSEAERLKQEFILRMEEFQATGAEIATDDESETTNFEDTKHERLLKPGVTKYAPVNFQGHNEGSLVLTDQGLTFFNSNDIKQLHLSWKYVTKHKISPVSAGEDLIRLVDSNLVSYVFRMKDRRALEQIRMDVKDRRRADWLHRSSINSDTGPESGNSDADVLKCHGINHIRHQSVNPTLGSFRLLVGPAGDARELLYISALHQTGGAQSYLPPRFDGTISCMRQLVWCFVLARQNQDLTFTFTCLFPTEQPKTSGLISRHGMG
jgi:hypothetical protein